MKKEHFEILLEDLYTLYNKDHLQYVADLAEKYSRHEFDAIQNIFIKYNNKRFATYDPNMGTDEHIMELIKIYSEGNRPLMGLDLKKKVEDKKKEIKDTETEKKTKEKLEQEAKLEHKIQEIEEELGSQVTKQIRSIEEYLEEREKEIRDLYEQKIKQLNKKIEEIIKEASSGIDESAITITSHYTESEVKLPNKKELAGLGLGTRIVTKNKEDKFVGLEIIDILYDCGSLIDEKTSIEIIIDKV